FGTLPGEISRMSVLEKSAEAVVARKAWKQAGQIFAPAKSAFPPSVAVSEGQKNQETGHLNISENRRAVLRNRRALQLRQLPGLVTE
ncbi:MAG: hypothetical protein LUQ11_11550, partial [Methylococcaceae bacterium]|nr:hypothetical protein [Methylococcaceae bacterium]